MRLILVFSKLYFKIFQLMKQDSYQRFLKSDLYTKDCVTAELEGRPLPYGPKSEQSEKVKIMLRKFMN